ncbi:MAG: protein translocase subunit SecF [Acidobacteriota bacterium]
MEFLTDTRIPFLKYRRIFVWVSLALLLVAVVELFALGGLNFGIDFVGGTQLTVKMRDATPVDDLRNALAAAGLREAQIQTYGGPEDNEVLIKTPLTEDSAEDSAAASSRLIDALDAVFNADRGDRMDLNQRGATAISSLLVARDPQNLGDDADLAADTYRSYAEDIIELRRELGVFTGFDQIRGIDGLPAEVLDTLESEAQLGAFQVLKNENVGPQIGEELRRKGYLAVILSLLGMLAYIWYRFELRFGVGALVAVFHDFLITLGLFALIDFEFNLSTIAAFLTLVGYSVNDTVVIFDRVRENLRRFRREGLEDVMNISINQTLSRTVLTSGTTLLVVSCLFFLGGEVLRGFSFVLLIGIIIGTYSSVFVASPFALLWEQRFGRDAKEARANKRSRATA